MQRDPVNALFETALFLSVAMLFAGALLGALQTPTLVEQPLLAKHAASQIAQSDSISKG